MICSSLNLLCLMSASFAGEQTDLEVRTFQGSRSEDVESRNALPMIPMRKNRNLRKVEPRRVCRRLTVFSYAAIGSVSRAA